jgi:hypothetical protein
MRQRQVFHAGIQQGAAGDLMEVPADLRDVWKGGVGSPRSSTAAWACGTSGPAIVEVVEMPSAVLFFA